MDSMAENIKTEIFEKLQSNIDADSIVREQIKQITQTLERQGRITLSMLSRAHSTPEAELQPIILTAENLIRDEIKTVGELANLASKSPYYKSVPIKKMMKCFYSVIRLINYLSFIRYNSIWSRDVQTVIFSIIFCGWLGGLGMNGKPASQGKLLSIEECGEILNVPVNLQDRDAFHITIEEYLQSLITLIDELARLAINSVTLGDYRRPLQISQFVKDLHAGFQILNLKNDLLRRRSDSIKYSVKKIEDIVYDLSLRNLVPK